ncbi:condensin complex component cnd1 [Saitoella complicata NRRL Y-17804]|uniref:Condensin complex subunit 1 n=1 Tax=Saitoella complicata (strain BCRC 22490 / CBS 7301 / JCM 7358 / NBRC 10748 / NRRL Y-17804) TaxID=698492 RepID=A0A0E9NFH3_SAICN|nr:condensin complex component cnd1 [Saitoella complicata NRRL Y-17804]ODQ49619.1 condensin complex component cnd1 [Saitoella complicata NRRL Y-17804]GAO48160.1 hypothetical protein G7K_2340-t1 [Saitoella complicata NRRL Y-17804]
MADQFDLRAELAAYLDDPSSVATQLDLSSASQKECDRYINTTIDTLSTSPEAIKNDEIFDVLKALLKNCAALTPTQMSKIMDLIVSSLQSETEILASDIEQPDPELLVLHRQICEMYAFLLQWVVIAADGAQAAKAVPARRGKTAKPKAAIEPTTWDSTSQVQAALDVVCRLLGLKLGRIWQTTSERDLFIGLFTRPIWLIAESEQRMKVVALRMRMYKVLCISIKHHGQAFAAQTSIVQALQYFEHLSEHTAEFLQILAEQYDYPQLAEEVVRELSSKEFAAADTKGPKSVATFVVKLSELLPRSVLKQMTSLARQLDSEAYAARNGVIEVCGNLIAYMSQQEQSDQAENHKTQINGFFDVLEERFLDINPYCRSKVCQVYTRLCDLETKFPKRKQIVADLAVRSLEDKSSNVRRNAIRLLTKLLSTHPFGLMHGGQLTQNEWIARLEQVNAELTALEPPVGTPGLAEKAPSTDVEDILDDATEASIMDVDMDDAGEEAPSTPRKKAPARDEEATPKAQQPKEVDQESLMRLQLTKRYYTEALRFIESLHEGSKVVAQLLASKNKSEIIEAMDFFVVADAYKLETSKLGIRKMLHLIWTKGNSDEGKGVQSHLIECYRGLFFEAPDHLSPNDAANFVARNMMSLTYGATLAELTSLEQLLSTMMKEGDYISDHVVQKLWQVYGVQRKEISKSQRRGAIIVLGMLGLANPEVIVNELETLLRVGLGLLGRTDLALAKYSCIALQRIQPNRKATQGQPDRATVAKLPNDHTVFSRLYSIVLMSSGSKEWFGVAEQAINAIYLLAEHPDIICGEAIRQKTRAVFQRTAQYHAEDAMEVEDGEQETVADTEASQDQSTTGLAQLLFIVGHVAIKQIVHIEATEREFKRRKANAAKKSAASAFSKGAPVEADELEAIGGTSEDDFTDAMAQIREHELLYGDKSLLARFGPMIADICQNNLVYKDKDLQSAAALALAKLMCVSSEFCERHLPLLLTILERSHDPITRSNVVIALGDMTVCFNHLVDENTDFLYRRLNDRDPSVTKTCLMTLTFLILAGQIKVRGQLAGMAKCLENSDKRIADLAKMFFTELATKDNAIYNGFTDIFSVLSADQEVSEDTFRRIVKFLMTFIEKEKHAKQLADKLVSRLPHCDSERAWNDVAYALSLLPHKNEDIQKTIAEGYKFAGVEA